MKGAAAWRFGAEHHDHTTRDAVVGGFARQRDAKRQRMMSGRSLRAEGGERKRYQGDTIEILLKHDVHSMKMYGAALSEQPVLTRNWSMRSMPRHGKRMSTARGCKKNRRANNGFKFRMPYSVGQQAVVTLFLSFWKAA